jgi:hypothetical protein
MIKTPTLNLAFNIEGLLALKGVTNMKLNFRTKFWWVFLSLFVGDETV